MKLEDVKEQIDNYYLQLENDKTLVESTIISGVTIIDDGPEDDNICGGGWNFRVLAHKTPYGILFKLHEVYYAKDGTPNGYVEGPEVIESEDLKGLRWQLNKMKEALKKPILMFGEEFPKEYDKNENTENQ